MGILSFEVAAAMLRALELWEDVEDGHLKNLRRTLMVGGGWALVVPLLHFQLVAPARGVMGHSS